MDGSQREEKKGEPLIGSTTPDGVFKKIVLILGYCGFYTCRKATFGVTSYGSRAQSMHPGP